MLALFWWAHWRAKLHVWKITAVEFLLAAEDTIAIRQGKVMTIYSIYGEGFFGSLFWVFLVSDNYQTVCFLFKDENWPSNLHKWLVIIEEVFILTLNNTDTKFDAFRLVVIIFCIFLSHILPIRLLLLFWVCIQQVDMPVFHYCYFEPDLPP